MKYILFWSTYKKDVDTSIKSWKRKPIELSPFHRLTLRSYVKHNLDVDLYTYQSLDSSSVPTGINLKDAGTIFSTLQAFTALEKGHSIAILSDCVRFGAAIKDQGVVIDMDAVILKPFTSVKSFYSTMPAKRTGGFAPKWGEAHPPIYINDKSWDGKALCAFPMRVRESNKKFVIRLQSKIKYLLNNDPKRENWTFILWAVKDYIRQDKTAKVYKPLENCPLPSWLQKGKCYSLESPTRLDGKTELFGHTLPSVEQIFKESNIVQHFFESAFNDSDTVSNDFWLNVPDDSLVGLEAKHIIGSNWKQILNES